jgi:hypothetical protein
MGRLMFKNEPRWQVVIFAMAAAMMLILVATLAARMYELETRPWGNECTEGETKPPTKDNFQADCYRGYWQYYPPGIP